MKRSKIEILDYLSDLSAPIGPEVFAGFGSKTQNDIHQAGEYITEQDALIRTWIEESDRSLLLQSLMDISKTIELENPYAYISAKFSENWDFHVTDLIYQACVPDLKRLEEVVDELASDTQSKAIARKLDKWLIEVP